MKIINHSILGGGLSALIRDQVLKNSKVFFNKRNVIKKSAKFYEFRGAGGNTNLWGGYINNTRLQYLSKNKKFKNFIKNNKLFMIRKLYKDYRIKTFYISEKKNAKIFRISSDKFNNKIINCDIQKILINSKYISLYSKKKIYKTKHLSLCIGNLGLIELLFKSNIISRNDQVSIRDGKCSYVFNYFINKKKNYYIPMTIKEIITKLIFKKISKYKKLINSTLLTQKFSNKSFLYTYKVSEIIDLNSSYIRYFLTNHPVELRINKIPIHKFLQNKSFRLKVFNSGLCKKYYPGPISQDIIYNALL